MEFNPGDVVYYEPDFDDLSWMVLDGRSVDTACVVIESDDSKRYMVKLRGWMVRELHAECIRETDYDEWHRTQIEAIHAAIAKQKESMTDDLALLAEAERKLSEPSK